MTSLEGFEEMADLELRRPKNQWWEKWIPLFHDLSTVSEPLFRFPAPHFHPANEVPFNHSHHGSNPINQPTSSNQSTSSNPTTTSKSESSKSEGKSTKKESIEISQTVQKKVVEETTTRLFWFSVGVGFSLLLSNVLSRK